MHTIIQFVQHCFLEDDYFLIELPWYVSWRSYIWRGGLFLNFLFCSIDLHISLCNHIILSFLLSLYSKSWRSVIWITNIIYLKMFAVSPLNFNISLENQVANFYKTKLNRNLLELWFEWLWSIVLQRSHLVRKVVSLGFVRQALLSVVYNNVYSGLLEKAGHWTLPE